MWRIFLFLFYVAADMSYNIAVESAIKLLYLFYNVYTTLVVGSVHVSYLAQRYSVSTRAILIYTQS